jgi:hypothetical protein
MNKYGVACPLIFIQILSREIGAKKDACTLLQMQSLFPLHICKVDIFLWQKRTLSKRDGGFYVPCIV